MSVVEALPPQSERKPRVSSSNWSVLAPRVALLLAPLPLVIVFLVQLCNQRPHYQFVPVYLAGLAWLCWRDRPGNLVTSGKVGLLQRCCLVAGIACLIPAVLLYSPWLAVISELFLLPAATLDLLPRTTVRNLFPVWVISWFIVPPPFRWDVDVLEALRESTSRSTGVFLDSLKVIHLQAGNTFEIPGKQFFVEDACSGIHSLLSIMGVALLWSVARRMPLVASFCSMACAAALAIGLNVVRVLTIVLAFCAWKVDLSAGWQHETLGFVLFAVAVLLLGSIQQFWQFWFAPIDPPAVRPSTARTVAVESDRSGRLSKWKLGVVAAALLVWVPQIAHSVRMGTAEGPLQQVSVGPVVGELDQHSLPSIIRGWKQVDYRTVQRGRHDQQGEFSKIWTFQGPLGLVQMSLDFPFQGPHPLLKCYRATGWTPSIQHTEVVADDTGGYQQVSLKRREYDVGTMVYCLWDSKGSLTAQREALPVKPRPLLWRMYDRILPGVMAPAEAPETTYQFQALVTGEFPLNEAQQQELLQLFLVARDQLRSQFKPSRTETASPALTADAGDRGQ